MWYLCQGARQDTASFLAEETSLPPLQPDRLPLAYYRVTCCLTSASLASVTEPSFLIFYVHWRSQGNELIQWQEHRKKRWAVSRMQSMAGDFGLKGLLKCTVCRAKNNRGDSDQDIVKEVFMVVSVTPIKTWQKHWNRPAARRRNTIHKHHEQMSDK